jgi:hypothetical protein
MNTRFLVSTTLAFAAALGGAATWAQTAPTARVLSDAAPLPPEDRSSVGAVVMPDAPVLARRESGIETMARTQQLLTTTMGAGPAITVQSDEGETRVLQPAQPQRKPKASLKP